MAQGLYKSGQEITVVYQSIDGEADLTDVVCRVYDEAHAYFISGVMTEMETNMGRYHYDFTPDAVGLWTVMMRNNDDQTGKVLRTFQVCSHNLDSIASDIALLGSGTQDSETDVIVSDIAVKLDSETDVIISDLKLQIDSEVVLLGAQMDSETDTIVSDIKVQIDSEVVLLGAQMDSETDTIVSDIKVQIDSEIVLVGAQMDSETDTVVSDVKVLFESETDVIVSDLISAIGAPAMVG